MKLGHVHLKVRDVERAALFYSRYLNMEIRERIGERFVFMSSGNLHHEIALQEVGDRGRTPARFDTGLFHTAFEVSDKMAFARSYQQLLEDGIRIAVVDHRISWAMYFNDPDMNGLEIYCDTRMDENGTLLWEGRDRPLTKEQILQFLQAD